MTFQLTDIKEDRVTKELVQQIEDYVDRMIDQGFDGQDVLDELETMGFTTIVKFLEIEWDMVYDETEWE
jgi:cytochrome P450